MKKPWEGIFLLAKAFALFEITSLHRILEYAMTSCQSHVHEPVRSDGIPSPQQLAQTAALFKALGDPARLLLLYQLKDGERCVGELVVDGNKLSTVSARLQMLLNANLVKRRRDARHLYYRLADQHVVELIDNALAHADEERVMSD